MFLIGCQGHLLSKDYFEILLPAPVINMSYLLRKYITGAVLPKLPSKCPPPSQSEPTVRSYGRNFLQPRKKLRGRNFLRLAPTAQFNPGSTPGCTAFNGIEVKLYTELRTTGPNLTQKCILEIHTFLQRNSTCPLVVDKFSIYNHGSHARVTLAQIWNEKIDIVFTVVF